MWIFYDLIDLINEFSLQLSELLFWTLKYTVSPLKSIRNNLWSGWRRSQNLSQQCNAKPGHTLYRTPACSSHFQPLYIIIIIIWEWKHMIRPKIISIHYGKRENEIWSLIMHDTFQRIWNLSVRNIKFRVRFKLNQV